MTIEEKIERISRALHLTHYDVEFLLDTIAQRDKEISEFKHELARETDDCSTCFKLRKKRDTAHASLDKYGRHYLNCARMFSGYGGMELKPCTCGFTAALEATK